MSKTVYGKVVKVDINADVKKRTGGTYKGYRLSYENDAGEIDKIEKTMQSLNFGNGPSVYETLKELQPGDDFTVILEKNEAGFNDVTGLKKGRDEDAVAKAAIASAPAVTGRPAGSSKVTSTYETPEERKLKQRLIVRQAALNQALEFAAYDTTNSYTLADIQEAAQLFEEWVYRGLD